MEVLCKKCNSTNCVKNGKVREKQRYKCKDCGLNYVQGDDRGRISPEAKAFSVLLYGSGKASYGMIARLFKISRSTVLYWIRNASKQLPEPGIDPHIEEIAFDEMWHFIHKKNKKQGYGEPWIGIETKPSDGLLAIVLLKRLETSLKSSST